MASKCEIYWYLRYGAKHRIIDTELFYILSDTDNEFTNYKWLCGNRSWITDCGNRPWSTLIVLICQYTPCYRNEVINKQTFRESEACIYYRNIFIRYILRGMIEVAVRIKKYC